MEIPFELIWNIGIILVISALCVEVKYITRKIRFSIRLRLKDVDLAT
jgi:hypothetical protein